MFKRILVALENSSMDNRLIPAVVQLAKLAHAELLLVHVADGWAARNFEQLNLTESEEMKEDRAYLQRISEEVRGGGLVVSTHLALGDPASEILKAAVEKQCDLIAMTTHGHRLIGDIMFGSTIEKVRHRALASLFIVSPEAT